MSLLAAWQGDTRAVMASRAAKSSRTSSTETSQDLDGNVAVAAPVLPGGSAAGIEDWLTRAEVAAVLRVSIATVRRLEGRQLHPQRSEEGFYMFNRTEVEAARARRPPAPEPRDCRGPGELAAEAFKLLRDGVDVRDLVIGLRRPPAEIEALYADWERMGDALVISSRVRSQLARMAGHGFLDDAILEAIEANDADTLRELVSDAINELDG